MNTHTEQKNYFDKHTSDVIKGVALVLMFVHHFFTFPEWYIPSVAYPNLTVFAQYFRAPSMICVSVFAFLTGYFYHFTSSKTYKYSIKKSTDLWLTYLFTFLALAGIALALGCYDFSVKKLVSELFALNYSTMCFCWYVVFYVAAMLILPIYAKLSERSSLLCFGLTFIIPLILGSIHSVFGYLMWFPCVASGYLFAKHRLFFQLDGLLKTKNRFVNILIGVLTASIAALTRVYSQNYDFICAPLFVYGIVGICQNINFKKLLLPLQIIGKYSLNMWFCHCVFFNSCKAYTQPILYFPKNPILVTLWGLLLCLASAFLLSFPIGFITKLKNKLFK